MSNPLHPVLPDDWKPLLLPRRGRRQGPPVTLDPEAPKQVRGLLKWYEPRLREVLANPANHAYAAAGNAYLDGEADPRGAAAAAAVIVGSSKRKSLSMLRPELDAWVLEHGLPFAACAAVERLAVWNGRQYYGYQDESMAKAELSEILRWHYYGIGHDASRGIAAIRGLLAAATEAEYAAVTAAVAAHRGTPATRLAAAFLLPDERDWVAEACDEYGRIQTGGHRRPDPMLWHSVGDPALLDRAGLTALPAEDCPDAVVAAIVDNLGPASLPVLTETLRRRPKADERRTLLRAVASLPSDAAIDYLVNRLSEPFVAEYAATSAEHFPAAFLSRATRASVSPRLTAIVRRLDPEALSETERAEVKHLVGATAPVPEADPSELPSLLTAPPWTLKRPSRKPVVVDGLTAPDVTRLEWTDAERAERESYEDLYDAHSWSWRVEHHGDDYYRTLPLFYAEAPIDLVRPYFEQWTGECRHTFRDEFQQILWRFGEEAADRIVAALRTRTERHAALVPVFSAAAARLAADWLVRLKAARSSALRWFDRHGLAAVPMLVPDALGTDKKARMAAEAALAHLAAQHGADAVAGAAEAFGPEAAAAIRAAADRDPLEPQAKLPGTAGLDDPELLPQVLLHGGRAVPAASVPHLVTVLSLTNPDFPYAGTAVAAEVCDAASLKRFSWALFELWIANGADAKGNWTLTQLARFGDDDAVRRLAPMIREWPGEGQHKRAVAGLGVLGAIGTEEALRAIQGIADRVKFKGLKEEARRQIDAIAANLGLTRDQLADRLVPDFGLGEAGALELDYGPRAFTVRFDEQLKPFVVDDTGKPRKSLPKPGAKDDPELAEAAYRRFSQLRKDLRTVAADQVRRLEAAMVAARTWTTDEFRQCFAEHAFMGHLARRMVWLATSDGESVAFRVAEDRTYSDADDDALELPADAAIRLAHPLHLDGAATAAWSALLADYEILQPFPQLDRPVMRFTEEERASGELTRFDKIRVESGPLLGLTGRGWLRCRPEDAGIEPGMYFPLPGGGSLVMNLSEGLWIGAMEHVPAQTFDLCWSAGGFYDRVSGDQAKSIMENLDPVTASEVLLSLDRLTGGRANGS